MVYYNSTNYIFIWDRWYLYRFGVMALSDKRKEKNNSNPFVSASFHTPQGLHFTCSVSQGGYPLDIMWKKEALMLFVSVH